MKEEKSQDPYMVPIKQFNELQAKHNLLKKSKQKEFRKGFLIGGGVVGVIALLYSSCQDTKPVPQYNHTDAGVLYNAGMSDAGSTDASAITPPCPDGQSCYSDDKICKQGQDCYDVKHVDDLESKLLDCLAENETLSKRQKNCPAYVPKPCPTIKELPPVKECPKMPYIRKGD